MTSLLANTRATTARIVTADETLRDDLLRLCAAAAVSPETTAQPADVVPTWQQVGLVLLGQDMLAEAVRLRLGRLDGLLVVGNRPLDESAWRAALDLRAEEVFELPAHERRLVDRLNDLADGRGPAAVTIGVAAAHGGAGASTFAASLALTVAGDGTSVLLVDADPLGGGIELVVGCEAAPGLRWREVATTSGRVGAAAFRGALPQLDGLAVLSFDREPGPVPEPATARDMFAAGWRGSDVVVVDLGRRPDEPWVTMAQACDLLLVVSTSEVRSVAAARASVPNWQALCRDVRLVVRYRAPGAVSADEMAACLELPVCATLPTKSAVARSVDEGAGPLRHRGLVRACRTVFQAVGRP